MRNSRAMLCLLVVVLAPAVRAAGQGPSAPGASEQAPLFPTRQSTFDIPFQIDEPIPGQEPVEVQLHVSENRGSTWSQAAKARPDEGRFAFQAPHDGEYWFFVRTLNKQGRLLPERPAEAELRVLVDTVPPTLDAKCTRGAAGEISCLWKLADPTLKPDTLELSYQGIGAGEEWRPVATPPSQPTGDGAFSGRTTFVPIGVKFPLYVRIEVGDAAGNRATTQMQVDGVGEGPLALPPVAPTNDAALNPTVAAARSPWQPHTPPPGVSPPDGAPYQNASSPVPKINPPVRTIQQGGPPSLPAQFPGREAIPTPPGRPAAGPPYLPTGDSRAPSPEIVGSPEMIAPGDVEALPSPAPDPVPTQRSLLPLMNRNARSTAPPTVEGPQLPTFPSLPDAVASAVTPTPMPTPEVSRPATATTNVAPRTGDEATPPGINPRMVNSKRFELEYDVESVGPSGVGKVELWTTRDAGRTWSLSGVDPDSTSPYPVTVDEEGIYGFRIVIETTSGLRSPTPQPGDLAEAWVGVDVTPPAVKIVSTQQRSVDAGGGNLDIRWEASDHLLPSRPFVLSFGEKNDGPWSTIASGLVGNGYEWRFDNRTPERMYLKLDARDAAGNTGTYVSPEPVVIERVKPQGRIRGVRPIGEQAQLRLPSQIQSR